ncbi:MAG: hypothetical protein KIT57_03700 [Blastocatellales bacterium]|nr:hypothetical protein [Blastocatellales bacterium]
MPRKKQSRPMKTGIADVYALMTPNERFIALRMEDSLSLVIERFSGAGPHGVLAIWCSLEDKWLRGESQLLGIFLRETLAEKPQRAMTPAELNALVFDGLVIYRDIIKVLRPAFRRTGMDFDGEGV